jgi:hypothetical protein
LAPDQGGQLLAAPNETWAKAITGNDADEVQVRPGEEAVYAFKDEKPATFAKFSILVDSSYGGNVKDLELLVGDESPVGSFRSIGKFTAQNLRPHQVALSGIYVPRDDGEVFQGQGPVELRWFSNG